MFSDIQIDAYFKRLNFKGQVCSSLEFLNELQGLHYMYIPYENLDILNGLALSLEAESIYQKIICNHRGGYCFELNGLYFELLTSLGFEVTNHYARFMLNRTELIPARSHRILKIRCNNCFYIVDVGVYSESPRIALELGENIVQYDGFAWYKFEKSADLGWILLQKRKNTEWKRFYSFTEGIYFPSDFKQCSFFYETSSESRFNKNLLAAIRTENGHIAIKDTELTITEKEKTVISTLHKEELSKTLSERFHITFEQITH